MDRRGKWTLIGCILVFLVIFVGQIIFVNQMMEQQEGDYQARLAEANGSIKKLATLVDTERQLCQEAEELQLEVAAFAREEAKRYHEEADGYKKLADSYKEGSDQSQEALEEYKKMLQEYRKIIAQRRVFPSPARDEAGHNRGAQLDGVNINILFDKVVGQTISFRAWAVRAEDDSITLIPTLDEDFSDKNCAHVEIDRMKLPRNVMIYVEIKANEETRYFESLLTGQQLSELIEMSRLPVAFPPTPPGETGQPPADPPQQE